MNRREFNRLGAAALLVSGHDAAREIQNYEGIAAWKLGIITDQVDFDLPRVLNSYYKKYRLRWAEIRYVKLAGKNQYLYATATPYQMRELKKQLDDAGVKLSVLDTAIYKVALPGTHPVGEAPAYTDLEHDQFNRQMDDLKRAAEVAHALGTRRIRIFSFRRVANPAAIFGRVVEELQKAAVVAQQHDVTLLVENEYDCNVATGEEIAALFAAIPDRQLMHNWDPCNCYEMGEQPFPTIWNQLDHSRISHIHLKDAAGKEWKPIGSGEIDFTGQFRALKSMNYAGTLSLETRYRDSQQNAYASSVESMNGLVRILEKI